MIYNNKLSDKYLEKIMEDDSMLTIHLLNGVKLWGKVINFDKESIELTYFDKEDSGNSKQIVNRKMILSMK